MYVLFHCNHAVALSSNNISGGLDGLGRPVQLAPTGVRMPCMRDKDAPCPRQRLAAIEGARHDCTRFMAGASAGEPQAIALAPRCEAANWSAVGSCNILNDWRRGHELWSSGHPKTMGSL